MQGSCDTCLVHVSLLQDRFFRRLLQAIAWSIFGLYMVLQITALLGSPINKYDDAIPLVSADLILHGRKPAVDFWSFYPPLYYYLVAAGFKLFGRTVLVPRLFAIALEAAVVWTATFFFLGVFPKLRPLIVLALFPLLGTWSVLRLAPWPGFALALLSLMVFLGSRRSYPLDSFWIAFAGLLGGISTLIRFNFGFYVMLVVGVDIVVNEVLALREGPPQLRLKRTLFQTSSFVIPFVLSNAIFYLWVYGADALAAPLHIIRYSMGVMTGPAFLRIRPQGSTLLYLVFPFAFMCARKILLAHKVETSALICAASGVFLTGLALLAGNAPSVSLWFPAVTIIWIIILHLTVSPLPRAALALVLFYVCMQHYFLSRADVYHSLLFNPVIALAIPFLFNSQDKRDQVQLTLSPWRRVLWAFVVVAFLLAPRYSLLQSIPYTKTALLMIRNGGLEPGTPDRERLLLTDPGLFDEVQATEFVRKKVAPSEPIYVGVRDHSHSFVNSVRAYWLAERLPGSRHVNLDTPVGAGKSAQLEIIAELQRNGVNWAILYNTAGSEDALLFERFTPGSKALDEYFADQFQEVASFGRYAVVTRRPTARAGEYCRNSPDCNLAPTPQ